MNQRIKNRIAMTQRAGGATLANLQRGTYGTQGEVKDYSIYDTNKLVVGTQVYNFFSVATGQAGKTIADTNLSTAGTIPQGQNMSTNIIKLMYCTQSVKGTTFVNDLYKFLSSSVLTIEVPGKQNLGQWTLQELVGANTLLALTPTAAGDNIPLIQPEFNGNFKLRIPIVLGGTTSFKAVLTCAEAIPASMATDKIIVSFNGVLASLS